MVSTRGIKCPYSVGERVLCYEPDPTKAKVLYDSKVLGVSETRDIHGKKVVQYKIHFQGWNSSWDRRVNADYVLKDTQENRQLQRDLAERAQLQLAAYLYRRDKQKRSRGGNISRNSSSSKDRSVCGISPTNEKVDNVKEGTADEICHTFLKLRSPPIECESESSSIESGIDEARVYLQIGQKLKRFLDFDFDMVVNKKKLHILPAKFTAITILENFVKHTALKLVFGNQISTASSRCRNSYQKREITIEQLKETTQLLKEIADGLRILLDFIISDHLLYPEEKEQYDIAFTEENIKKNAYLTSAHNFPDFLNLKLKKPEQSDESDFSESHSATSEVFHQDECVRRRLRSNKYETDSEDLPDSIAHFHEECYLGKLKGKSKQISGLVRFDGAVDRQEKFEGMMLEEGLILKQEYAANKASSRSGESTSHVPGNSECLNIIFNSISSITSIETRNFLQDIFSWTIVPAKAPVEASMLYGAVHLARLLVKLPNFLNLTLMKDDKLQRFVPLLESFYKFLESHKEWFGEHNYSDNVIVVSDFTSS